MGFVLLLLPLDLHPGAPNLGSCLLEQIGHRSDLSFHPCVSRVHFLGGCRPKIQCLRALHKTSNRKSRAVLLPMFFSAFSFCRETREFGTVGAVCDRAWNGHLVS